MNFLKKYFALLTGLFVFLIYIITLAPTVVEIDAGELATVQATLGIAHPTGYPLFTILGYLFSLIHFPFSKIYQLNLLAAFWCSIGVGLFAFTSKKILDNLGSFGSIKKTRLLKKEKFKKNQKSYQPSGKNEQTIPELKKYLVSVFGALILAFDKTYWMQSTSVEVYSLQMFLFNLIIYFVINSYINSNKEDKPKFNSGWTWVAFALALGFTNHMTTMFILPGIAFLYFEKYGFNRNSFQRIGIMLLIFVPLLAAVYSYLPIRSAQNPILNWGDPSNIARFFRHVEGNQYKVWLFSSSGAAVKQLNYFISNLPGEFYATLFICAVGLVTAFIRAKKLFIFLLITFSFTLLYSINYDIKDIDSYFLLSYISISFFGTFGIVQLFSLLKARRHNYILPAGLVLFFLIVQAYLNFNKVNQNDVYVFEDYTKSAMNFCSRNSIILSYEWDYLISPSYYFQYVEKFRPDITLVDKELLRRSWYYKQMNYNHPALLAGMRPDVNAFLKAVAPFESGLNFDPDLLERLYRNILTDIVASNISKRDVYIAPEIFDNEMQKGEFKLPKGYTLVPDVLMFKVVKGNEYVPAQNPDFTIRFPSEGNQYSKMIANFIGSMLVRRALYEMQFDKIANAKIYIQKIKKSIPDYNIPPGLEAVLIK